MDEYFNYLTGYIYFISFIKFVRLLRFNNRFAQLMLTLETAWEDLVGFFGVFFLIFCAFVQMFYYILYTQLDEFSTFIKAFETCFTMLLGRFKFGSLKATSMTVGFVTSNMFSTIMKQNLIGTSISILIKNLFVLNFRQL